MKNRIEIKDLDSTYLVEISEDNTLQEIHGGGIVGEVAGAVVDAAKFVYEVGRDVGCAIRNYLK